MAGSNRCRGLAERGVTKIEPGVYTAGFFAVGAEGKSIVQFGVARSPDFRDGDRISGLTFGTGDLARGPLEVQRPPTVTNELAVHTFAFYWMAYWYGQYIFYRLRLPTAWDFNHGNDREMASECIIEL